MLRVSFFLASFPGLLEDTNGVAHANTHHRFGAVMEEFELRDALDKAFTAKAQAMSIG